MPRRSRTINPSRRAVANVRSVSPESTASARLKNPRFERSRYPKFDFMPATLEVTPRRTELPKANLWISGAAFLSSRMGWLSP